MMPELEMLWGEGLMKKKYKGEYVGIEIPMGRYKSR